MYAIDMFEGGEVQIYTSKAHIEDDLIHILLIRLEAFIKAVILKLYCMYLCWFYTVAVRVNTVFKIVLFKL